VNKKKHVAAVDTRNPVNDEEVPKEFNFTFNPRNPPINEEETVNSPKQQDR
jgi:hypothetical protein